MLSGACFLVEEFVEAEEFACDGFWDEDGKTVITGIYRHPFASDFKSYYLQKINVITND
jgi:hypothetical protein